MEEEDIKKRRSIVRDKVRNFYIDNRIGMEEILTILVEDATYYMEQGEDSEVWDFWNKIGKLLARQWEVCEGKSLKVFWKEEKDKKYLAVEFS